MYGFTLIQYIITITIVCILSTFTQPTYLQLQQKHLAMTTIRTIRQCLQYARMQAIVHHSPITITPIRSNDWSYGLMISNKTQTFRTYKFHKNWKISWNGFGNIKNRIYLLSNGMTHNNGHFTLQHSQKPTIIYTLFISKTLKTHIASKPYNYREDP